MEPNRTGHAPSTTSDHPDAPTTEQVNAAVTSFTLLADPTRVRMLWALREQDLDVATLARIADCRPTVASQHRIRVPVPPETLNKARDADMAAIRKQLQS